MGAMDTGRAGAGGGRAGLDREKIGAFLVQLRKERGLTQRELAERLYVSDKTVSKWERAQGLPDIKELRGLYKLMRGLSAPVGADAWFMEKVSGHMNYCKYRVSLAVFQEAGLLRMSADLSRMELVPVEGKVDLEGSETLCRVRKMAGK